MRTYIAICCIACFVYTGQAQRAPDSLRGRERANYLIDRAYSIYSADFTVADSLFTGVEAEARQQGWDPERAAALKYLGIIRFLTGDYSAALARYQQSLDLYKELADPIGQAAVLIEMGNFFKKRSEYDRARKMLQQGEALSRSGGDSVLLSNSLDIQGLLALDGGDPEVAGDFFREVLDIRRAIRDTVGLTYVFDHMGSLAISRGAYGEALALLDSTILLRRRLGDRQGEAIAVNNQGEALLVAADTAAAIPYLLESLELSRAVAFTDLQQWTMGLLAEAYAATDEYPTALRFQRQVQELRDSIYSAATSRQIAEMQERYEAAERQQELDRRAAQIRQRNAWLVAAGLGLLLLVGALVALYQRSRQRRRELRREAELRLRDDRLRISRDLHDHLGAELGIIASDLNRLHRQGAAFGLDGIVEQLRYAIEQMRETIWAVRLERGTWSDLFARLRQFADRLEGPAVTFDLDPGIADDILEPQAVLDLYRFGQEALRNAVRHAEAGRIRVTADRDTFAVTDDGKGLPPPGLRKEGYGLEGLAERARQLNGSLILTPADDGGTSVRLRFGRAIRQYPTAEAATLNY